MEEVLECFIADSWIGIIKFTLYLFKIHRFNLMCMEMEEIILYFGNLFLKQESLTVLMIQDLPIETLPSFKSFYFSCESKSFDYYRFLYEF